MSRPQNNGGFTSNATTWIRFVFVLVIAGMFGALVLGESGCASTWSGSIGAILARDNATRRVYVRDVPDGMPAARVGLVSGDEIVAIEGKTVVGMSAEEVHSALEGRVGSKVRLTIATRGDGGMKDFTLERAPLKSGE